MKKARALSSAAKWTLHAARNGSVSRMDRDDNEITDATINALAKRGLFTIDLQTLGRWCVASLTDEGRLAYADIECRVCRGSAMVPSPEYDGTGITCTTCRGLGYMK